MTADRPTNFFARQERARLNRRNHLIFFAGAVMMIVFVTTIALRFAWYLYLSSHAYTTFNAAEAQSYERKLAAFTLFDPASFLVVAAIIVGIILAAFLYKMQTLQKGGSAVAEMLGARRIPRRSTDPAERRLINVVEEMAIAASIPMPQIYVMDSEYNINAFAAGLTLTDAAVTVTKGTLDKLTRDELQGVIAHEFSHILNGDMRLNVQLIGVLYGILFIGLAGRKFLSGSKVSFRAGLPAIVAGFLLTVIGYMGSFLGRIMQCAISRQQEMLADASAVQFTRNPMGLAGALKKIGGSVFGSRIRSAEAEQASHLFFSESHPDTLFDFLATHPPLMKRIRLLDPSFDGKFITVKDDRQKPQTVYVTPYTGATPNIPLQAPLLSAVAENVVRSVGNPSPESIQQSKAVLSRIPPDMHQTLTTPAGAAAVIYALLLDQDDSRRAIQANFLSRSLVVQGKVDFIVNAAAQLAGLPRELRLPLIEITLPALAELSSMEKRNFLLLLNSVINADGKISLLELSVQWLLNKYLNPAEKMFDVMQFTYSRVGLDIVVLIRALACAGHPDSREKAENAFRKGIARIPELAARNPDFVFEENASYANVNRALTHLTATSYKIRQSVIDACAHCALADQTVTFEEGELLRVVALALQCPLPPLAAAS